MKKTTSYLWTKDFPTFEQLALAQQTYADSGFRVVTYDSTFDARDVHTLLQALIQYHITSHSEDMPL